MESDSRATDELDHFKNIVTRMNVDRFSSDFRDLTLIVEGLQIPVHRHVMVTYSKYFEALVSSGMSDSRRTTIDLKGLTAIGVQAVVSFAYTYRVDLNEENVSEILTAAAYLQIDQIVARCDTFLKQMIDLDNYMDILDFTEAYPQLVRATDTVHRFVLRKFEDVASSAGFYRLSCQLLTCLLRENSLRVPSEYELFRIVIKWIEHDVSNREKDVASLMRNVRFPLFSHGELWGEVNKENIMTSNEECMDLIKEARIYQALVKEQPMRQTSRTQIRSVNQSIIVGRDKFESFDSKTGKYVSLNCRPTSTFAQSVCVVDNFMYVCGGISSRENALPSCSRYDPRLNSWFNLPDMYQPRHDFALVALDKYLYAIGGRHEYRGLKTVERFSIEKCAWERCSGTLPNAVYGHAGVALGERIYISGGYTVDVTDAVLSYDPVSDTWKEEPKLLKKRTEHYMLEWKGRLLVVGGHVDYLPDTEIEWFLPSTGKWTFAKEHLCMPVSAAIAVEDGICIASSVCNTTHIARYLPDEDRIERRVSDVHNPVTRGRVYCKLTVSEQVYT